MALMAWSSDLSVGVEALDDDHKKLIAMINQLYDAMTTGKSKEVLGDILDGLDDYTVTHFEREERLLAQAGYPGIDGHCNDHEWMKNQVSEIRRQYHDSAGLALTIETMNFLKTWITNHILQNDKLYSAHMNAQGIR